MLSSSTASWQSGRVSQLQDVREARKRMAQRPCRERWQILPKWFRLIEPRLSVKPTDLRAYRRTGMSYEILVHRVPSDGLEDLRGLPEDSSALEDSKWAAHLPSCYRSSPSRMSKDHEC